jgi:hypothetical protein
MLEEAILNANIIDVQRYFLDVERTRSEEMARMNMKLYSKYSVLPGFQLKRAVPYDVLVDDMKTKFALDAPKDLVSFFNATLTDKRFSYYEYMMLVPIHSLNIFQTGHSETVLFGLADSGRNRLPLVWNLERAYNEFAFFKLDASKNEIAGIYLKTTSFDDAGMNPVSMGRFLVTEECYNNLLVPVLYPNKK